MHSSWQRAALFRPVDRHPLPVQIADQIRRLILLGDLATNNQLPSIRQLAESFGVSVPTVRQALHALAYLGIIDVRHGVGTFVVRLPEAPRALSVSIRRARPHEVLELTREIEVAGARRAAERAAERGSDDDDFRDLQHFAIERWTQLRGSPESFLDADYEFHRGVIAAGGSLFAVELHARLSKGLRSTMRGAAHRLRYDEQLHDLHQALVEAIMNGDPEAATRAALIIARAERPHARAPA